ncbi:hypothetical protein BX666DRAFT_1856958 [Dichotomocladium elegans]|nr:hypothetical protein BX666DRAFT_1856958 [Dichotomocladium elegans]
MDAWILQSWLMSLSKSVLCQIAWKGMTEHHDLAWPSIQQYYCFSGNGDGDHDHQQQQQQQQHPYHYDPARELQMVVQQARKIAHRLDSCRPSEQFAYATQVAQEYHHLIRLATSTLQHSPRLAVIAIVLIVKESFKAPSEVRQHIYYQSKLGRLAVLEIVSVLKRQDGDLEFHKWFDSSNSSSDGDSNIADWVYWPKDVEEVCGRLARYDTTWEFRHEYQNVVRLMLGENEVSFII